jgi:hypothetical protein
VESLNADKGYDRMAMEMLAGDEIALTDPDTLRATGFLVRVGTNSIAMCGCKRPSSMLARCFSVLR